MRVRGPGRTTSICLVAAMTFSLTVATAMPSEAETAPGPPANVIFAGGLGGATVRWDAASTQGGPAITSYIVDRSGRDPRTLPATARQANFKGLRDGRDYSFYVRAVNADGVRGPKVSRTLHGTRLTLNAKASVPLGRTVTLTGRLSRSATGRGIVGGFLWLRIRADRSSPWTYVRQGGTVSKGHYEVKYKPVRTYQYQVRYAPRPGWNMGCRSPIRTVTVT